MRLEVQMGFEPMRDFSNGVADRSVQPLRILNLSRLGCTLRVALSDLVSQTSIQTVGFHAPYLVGEARIGLAIFRLSADCSTTELLSEIFGVPTKIRTLIWRFVAPYSLH